MSYTAKGTLVRACLFFDGYTYHVLAILTSMNSVWMSGGDAMNAAAVVIALVQLVFTVIIGMYFFNLLRMQQGNRTAIDRESARELERLRHLRNVSLSEPLAERTRPSKLADIVGQEDGLRALRAALCGPHPQHVLIYGPPGVGKTAAARVLLDEAKRTTGSPFQYDATFIELDATTARFDERGIADPLIGSVHDPIYQGAGAMGVAGIPQPKAGAVTKAHGGVLFIDEIGELHPIQMNKLLKVLEDRRVYFESAYYSEDDNNIPAHIHDIFQNGLPADFRLVGATTRSPQEIPPAIRSRCLEIFFRPLTGDEIGSIVRGAAKKISISIPETAVDLITRHAKNGREAVNLVQLAAGTAITDHRSGIATSDVEWVIQSSQLSPRPERKIADKPQIGVVNGLAVYGPSLGMLLEVEATAMPASGKSRGVISVSGVVEEEELGSGSRVIRRKSMARSSIDNVLTALQAELPVNLKDFDIHVNFPGGVPVDGPSAGVSIATAIYSAITQQKISNDLAMTGEVTIHGGVRAVGGVPVKVAAARLAGVIKVLVPLENKQEQLGHLKDMEIVYVDSLRAVLKETFANQEDDVAISSITVVNSSLTTLPPAIAQGS